MSEPNKVWGKMHALTLGKCSDLLILLMVPVKPNYVIFKSSIIGEPFFLFFGPNRKFVHLHFPSNTCKEHWSIREK